jgi:cysteine-rich repeat protein
MGRAPFSLSEPIGATLGVPIVTIANADAELLGPAQRALPMRARMHADVNQYAGADPSGRPYLFTNDPADPGSNVSHFESLARPDLLMEPASRDRTTHEVDLTRALLADLGWTRTCGNGRLEPGELCDEGPANSDNPEARCHTTCKPAACGDGIVSRGEQCDDGVLNSDTQPDTCRLRCESPRCGDGVVDRGEVCDGAGCSERCDSSGRDGRGDSDAIARWPVEFDDGGPQRDGGGCSLPADAAGRDGAWMLGVFLISLVARRRRRTAA